MDGARGNGASRRAGGNSMKRVVMVTQFPLISVPAFAGINSRGNPRQ
jgi:hypothetical protein